MSGDYEVGYGKPPVSGQFKKGQSGNPNGRPKGAKSLGTIVQTELATRLSITLDGQSKQVSRLEALVMKLMQDALAGDAKAQAHMLKLAGLYVPEDSSAETASLPPAEGDQALIKAFLKRMQAKAKSAEDSGET